MPTFGARLAEERERLRHTQQSFADECQVTMRSQRNYEKGDRLPDAAYLAEAARLGADLVYLVTGQKADSKGASVNKELLQVTIEVVSDLLDRNRLALPPDKLAELVVLIYEHEIRDNAAKRTLKAEVRQTTERFLRLVA